MRIPKPVNTALDWVEAHRSSVAWVTALVVAAGAGLLLPSAAGTVTAAFVLGVALGGFVVHVRGGRRIDRARAEIDDLLRQNGRLRHRNTILSSGVITRESAATQALMSIPEDEDDPPARGADESQTTHRLPELPKLLDELLGEHPASDDAASDDAASDDAASEDEPSAPTRPRTIRGEVTVEKEEPEPGPGRSGPGDTAALRKAGREVGRDRDHDRAEGAA